MWSNPVAGAFLLLVMPALLCGQDVPQTPTALMRQALDRRSAEAHSLTRFTFFDLQHDQNRDHTGKLFYDRTTLYEETWIADLPYRRVVEVEGKPLAGKELAKEQERYDQALRERRGLDAAARANLIHNKLLNAGLHLDETITPAYRLTELRREVFAGQPTHVLEAIPVPSADPAHPAATKQFQLWISEADPAILRLTFNVVSDEPDMLRESHGEQEFALVNSVPMLQHQSVHFTYPNHGKPITGDVEHTYTRYRRFSASARILPGDQQVPPE